MVNGEKSKDYERGIGSANNGTASLASGSAEQVSKRVSRADRDAASSFVI